MVGELPSQAVTTWMGNCSTSSVSRDDRRFTNSFGHGVMPARMTRFLNAEYRTLSVLPRPCDTTYSAPSAARSRASASTGRSSGNNGTDRYARPARCSVFGEWTVNRDPSQSMYSHRSFRTSLGHRRPPYRTNATIVCQSGSQCRITNSVVARSTKNCRAVLVRVQPRILPNGLTSIHRWSTAMEKNRLALRHISETVVSANSFRRNHRRKSSASPAVIDSIEQVLPNRSSSRSALRVMLRIVFGFLPAYSSRQRLSNSPRFAGRKLRDTRLHDASRSRRVGDASRSQRAVPSGVGSPVIDVETMTSTWCLASRAVASRYSSQSQCLPFPVVFELHPLVAVGTIHN
jgi:hypothetical protein